MYTAQGSSQMTHPPLPYYSPAWGKDTPLISSGPVSPPVNGMLLLGHNQCTGCVEYTGSSGPRSHGEENSLQNRGEFSAEQRGICYSLGIANSTFSIASTEGPNSLENFRLI